MLSAILAASIALAPTRAGISPHEEMQTLHLLNSPRARVASAHWKSCVSIKGSLRAPVLRSGLSAI